MFLFTGVGMLNIFSFSHGEEQALLGAGLVEIMRDFLIVMVLIALFLVTLVLSFLPAETRREYRAFGDAGNPQ